MLNTDARTILMNIHGQPFYDSDKHVQGDTRIKKRCTRWDYIWQHANKDDFDGSLIGACIAIDTRELADLKERGVKYYECHYPAGLVYRISIETFEKFAHPVHNRAGDGSQVCCSIRHWREDELIATKDGPAKQRSAAGKAGKASKASKKDGLLPLRFTNPEPSTIQERLL